MGFVPKSGRHAIIEIVFGLVFARPFFPPEIEAVVKAHDIWKDRLPRMVRSQMIQVALGGGSGVLPPMAAPSAGVGFDRMKPDGSLEWRLRVEDNTIFVNNLDYQGWETTWPQVLSLLQEATGAACESDDNRITATVFQVVNLFEWEGERNAVNTSALLSRDSKYIPELMWEVEGNWHIFQGWFKNASLPENVVRVLQKPEISLLNSLDGKPVVKLDILQKSDLASPVEPRLFIEENGAGPYLFQFMHRQNKDIVRQFITEDMAERISLDG